MKPERRKFSKYRIYPIKKKNKTIEVIEKGSTMQKTVKIYQNHNNSPTLISATGLTFVEIVYRVTYNYRAG